MFQYQTQSTRPLTTAHLAQTMTLLSMNALELEQKIEAELAKNPALELVEERRCPTCRRKLMDPGPCPVCSRPKSLNAEEPIVFVSSYTERFEGASLSLADTDELPDDNIAPSEELPGYVLKQIAAEIAVEDRQLAAHILTNLDDNGLLPISLFEISRYHHVPVARLEAIIRLIQRADPLGVGSASTSEAMMVQLEVLRERGAQIHPLAEKAISTGMEQLLRKQHRELANILGCTAKEAEQIAQFIGTNLNPYPARAFWGDIRQGVCAPAQRYHQPDIIIKKLNQKSNTPLVVEILMPMRGTLQLNQLFRQAAKNADDETVEKWKKDIDNAMLLIKCIQQRNNTMQRLIQYLSRYQRQYILKGDQYLAPITRAKIADELSVHESTISRAVSNKSVELPSGKIVPLSIFFDRSLHIRAQLKEMIQSEKNTLTDAQLARKLAERGYKIARRTVAKYRAMEGILPAHIRKNQNQPQK